MNASGDIDWQSAYQDLDPLEPIPLGSEAYCQRPEPPLERLAATLRLTRQPSLYLVSGHIGSGKSTELFRLVESLSGTHRCFLEQVDADLRRGAVDDEAFIGLLKLATGALRDGAQSGELKLTKAKVTDAGTKITSAGIMSPQSQETSSASLEDVVADTNQVRSQWDEEPLVVLDGFDKVNLAELERLFVAVSSWGALPVSVVLTVPLSFLFTPLYARSQSLFASTAVVPAIRLRHRNGSVDPKGAKWMRSILRQRGVGELFTPEAADHLITQTGGILRDLLRVARESVLTAHLRQAKRVVLEYAQDAVKDFSLSVSRAVSPEDLRLLCAVHRAGRVIGNSSFLEMIDSGQIIEYRNGSNWYAIHPLLEDAVVALSEDLK